MAADPDDAQAQHAHGLHVGAREHLVPVLGMLPLGEIGVSEVNGYLAAKADTLRPKTLTNHLSLRRSASEITSVTSVISSSEAYLM